jgi:hypothetical protein
MDFGIMPTRLNDEVARLNFRAGAGIHLTGLKGRIETTFSLRRAKSMGSGLNEVHKLYKPNYRKIS